VANEAGDRKTRRPCARDGDLYVFQFAASNLACVEQSGSRNDRRPVLVVVEDRDIEFFPQLAISSSTMS
jgi:hypothetical protein